MKQTIYKAIVAFVVLLASAAPVGANMIMSTFDADDEGWGIVSFEWMNGQDYDILGSQNAGYNTAGGYIFTNDADDGDFTYQAPDKFLGNQVDKYGYLLSFDIIDYGSGSYYHTTDDVMLVGGGKRLLWTSSHDIVPQQFDWTHVDVQLANSSHDEWRVFADGVLAEATQNDFFTVLNNLSGLYIRGEYVYGLSETGKLDNVHFGSPLSVPEPASLLLLGAGVAAVAAFRRRSGRKVR